MRFQMCNWKFVQTQTNLSHHKFTTIKLTMFTKTSWALTNCPTSTSDHCTCEIKVKKNPFFIEVKTERSYCRGTESTALQKQTCLPEF